MSEDQNPMRGKREAQTRARRKRELRSQAWSLGCSPELLRAYLADRDRIAGTASRADAVTPKGESAG